MENYNSKSNDDDIGDKLANRIRKSVRISIIEAPAPQGQKGFISPSPDVPTEKTIIHRKSIIGRVRIGYTYD